MVHPLSAQSIQVMQTETAVLSGNAPNLVYQSIWRLFRSVIDEKVGVGTRTDAEYLTAENVSLFYREYVKYSRISPQSVKRYKWAIQFYIKRIFASSANRFNVEDCDGVDEAIQFQMREFNMSHLELDKDPHAKVPTDTLTPTENIHAMRTLLTMNAHYWQSMALSWTLGNSCFIRPDTFIKLRLSSLRLDTRHAPPMGDDFIVSYLLLPTDLKGGRNNGKGKTRVVGSYRHKEYLRCAVGFLSMILFVKFRHNEDIDFYRGPASKPRPRWWNIRICDDWISSDVLCKQYKRFLEECALEYCKCSYIRTSGMDEAAYEGELTQDPIASMSKHIRFKFDVYYMCELCPNVMRVLAGFRKDEAYNVPRTDITFEAFGTIDLVKILFPKIDVWRSQTLAPNGDKSECANNFLNFLLPAITKVILQDGIFFIRDFPNHIISQYLRSIQLPINYELWAKTQRERLDKNNSTVPVTLTPETQVLLTELEAIRSDISELKDRVSTSSSHTPSVNHESSTPTSNLRNVNDVSGVNNESSTSTLNLRNVNDVSTVNDEASTSHSNLSNINEVSSDNIESSTSTSNLRNVNDVLRNTPTIQNIPKHLPSSVTALLNEHLFLGLHHWNQPSVGIDRSIKMAFLRRAYLFNHIKSRADVSVGSRNRLSEENNLKRAADIMDKERDDKGQTLRQYIDFLKSTDSQVRKRKLL